MSYKDDARASRAEKLKHYADGGDVGIGERIARFFSGGRDHGQRVLYNETRAGLLNSDTAPEHGSTYGGIGLDLDSRRRLQGYDSQSISDAVPRRKENE